MNLLLNAHSSSSAVNYDTWSSISLHIPSHDLLFLHLYDSRRGQGALGSGVSSLQGREYRLTAFGRGCVRRQVGPSAAECLSNINGECKSAGNFPDSPFPFILRASDHIHGEEGGFSKDPSNNAPWANRTIRASQARIAYSRLIMVCSQ
jgi:hypothetical protein